MSKKKVYGFCYDKQGNLREVSPPVNAIQTIAMYPEHNPNPEPLIVESSKKRKTQTGRIPSGVGYSRWQAEKSL